MNIRFLMISSMVDSCDRVIDVGADHGIVSIMLAGRKDIGQVLATDISEACLSKLVETMEDEDFPQEIREKISYQVTDGLHGLIWEKADCLVIAGMGAELMLSILDGEPAFAEGVDQLVLAPQNEPEKVRAYLYSQGWSINHEQLAHDDFYYPVISCQPHPLHDLDRGKWLFMEGSLSPLELHYGPYLLSRQNPVAQQLIMEDLARVRGLMQELTVGFATPAKIQRAGELLEEEKALKQLLQKYWPGLVP